jgi:hypothetical protein
MQMTVEEAALLLGVRVDDSIDEVRSGYRRRLFEVHPDHGGNSDETRQLVIALNVLARAHTNHPVRSTTSQAQQDDVPGEVVWRVDADTLALPLPADETYARLVEVAHQVGDVTYVDRQCGVLEALLRTRSGTTISMVVSLQGRSNGSTEAFFTLEPIDAVKGDLPTVQDITDLVASYLLPPTI